MASVSLETNVCEGLGGGPGGGEGGSSFDILTIGAVRTLRSGLILPKVVRDAAGTLPRVRPFRSFTATAISPSDLPELYTTRFFENDFELSNRKKPFE